jgi:hypothetical protein
VTVVGCGERLFGQTTGTKPFRLIDNRTVGDGLVFLTLRNRPGRLAWTEQPHDRGTVVTVLLMEGVAVAVEGVGFVGLRSDQFSEMVRLFRDVIGVPLAREAIGMAGFRLRDGTVLEIYGPADEFHSFFTTGPVVGLRVGDFDAVRALMLAAEVQFIGAVQHADGLSWQHFCCPDGTVLEMIGPGTPPASPSAAV